MNRNGCPTTVGICTLPDNINVTVIDYDTEGVEKDRLEISPVDGELCVITRW
jgi:hypothetical protein